MQNINYKKYFMTALGCFIISLGLNCFYIQQHFLSGGISGISMILHYVFNVPVGLTSLVLNLPLFYLAYRFLGKEFLSTTVFGSIALAFFMDATAFLNARVFVQDTLLSALAGGFVNGLGCAILYREGSSSGGGDIIAYLLHKYRGISIGAGGMLINLCIMFFSIFLFGLEPVLYSCIAFFISFKSISTFVAGFDFKKDFIIISEHPEELATAITSKVGRGVTFLHGTGAYTGKERKIIFVVVKLRQVADISRLIKQIDPTAFVIIHDTGDVLGKGFTLEPDIVVPKA